MQDQTPIEQSRKTVTDEWIAAANPPAVYPQRFGTMTLVMLDASTLETIRGAFFAKMTRIGSQSDDFAKLGTHPFTSLWINELWTIDRACRVLGIDS